MIVTAEQIACQFEHLECNAENKVRNVSTKHMEVQLQLGAWNFVIILSKLCEK